MMIECDSCEMQHTTACDDCIVTVLWASAEHVPTRSVHLSDTESDALGNLADAGLVAPLRLVPRQTETEAAAG